ncbi:phosphoserine phosphatase SerB [Palleronia caenipelagi]|uniref:Phosphoserine phosphatase n=1 Tax=Palleronia caenipelagi TaxID=2489174 RepID=A0A547Q2P2_9RHOB|nr:phosphoserine phosphatase SerB [Palleronia caenipelagi]TRD20631.1 phosphoserine phosphatase SerB [Palleronia caenipelagi]
MQIVSLIAARALDPAFVEALRNAWGGGDAVWLNPALAAEFAVESTPGNAEDVWAEAQKMGVDLCIQPEAGRRKEVLIADMDSTMIGQECIDELAEVAGVGAQVRDITARAMNGELDFEGALRERVGLLEGLSTDVIQQVWESRITLTPGGEALLATMRANGGYAALVSGGFTQFTARVSERLGFDEHRANTLIEENGLLTGQVGEPILGRDAKVAALQRICDDRGISTDRAMAVGDGANDLGMLQLAGAGVALHAKPTVAAQAKLRINHGDLSALLYLQGYASEDFTA